VGHQVYLQEARPFVIPVGKGPDGDGRFEQASWFGGAEGTPQPSLPVGLQHPVNGSHAHPAKLLLYLIGQGQFSVAL